MRRHLLFGVQGPNKGAAGPARSPTQPSSTVPWGATRSGRWETLPILLRTLILPFPYNSCIFFMLIIIRN